MARVTVEDCLERDSNRFALCLLASRRARQLEQGQPALVKSTNRAAITALREIAAGRIRASVDTEATLAQYAIEQNALFRAQEDGERTSPMLADPIPVDERYDTMAASRRRRR